MMRRALEEIQRSNMDQITQMYELFDTRGKGYIDASALIEGMRSLGYEIDKQQINDMINFLSNEDGKKGVITKQAFKKFMSSKLHMNDPQQDIKAAFEYFDQDNRGKITLGDLKRVAQQFGQNVEECETIMKQVDKNGNGFLSYEQFIRIIKKTSYD